MLELELTASTSANLAACTEHHTMSAALQPQVTMRRESTSIQPSHRAGKCFDASSVLQNALSFEKQLKVAPEDQGRPGWCNMLPHPVSCTASCMFWQGYDADSSRARKVAQPCLRVPDFFRG